MSRAVTEVTHNHPEGIRGAEATAVATFLARSDKSMADIRKVVVSNYYRLNFSLDEIRDSYKFDVSCQGSVPQALEAFFESTSFEDAIRNAISIGGDSDTIGAICVAVAGALVIGNRTVCDIIAKQMPESRHPSRPFDIFNTPNCQKVGISAILLP